MSNQEDEAQTYGTPNKPDSSTYDTNSIGSSMLYKTLLQQSMQQPQGSGVGGILAKMLGTYMSMYGQNQANGIANTSYSMGGD